MSRFGDVVFEEFNRRRAAHFAGDGYEGVTHAGIALLAMDTGRIFLAQRSMDETDDLEVQETWEFPGGGLNPGEEPYTGAVRELIEETGWGVPEDSVVAGGWRSENGVYQGFVVTTAVEFDISGWGPTGECQAVAWMDRETIEENENLRPEVRDQTDWDYIFGIAVSRNEEDTMAASAEIEPEIEEPDLTMADLMGEPLMVHGILAPEDTESGDSRGFSGGAVTARPYRLPFSWQKSAIQQHDGSVMIGGVDRLMRKDGMIHWEGSLMPTEEASEFAGWLAFMGRLGVSVDGDKGSLDMEKSHASGVLWFDAVRAAGLTSVAIPAFSEAYVAFGPHPDMPEEESEEFEVLRASGDLVAFDRGPGWVTNPRETKRIHDYWTKKGQPGYAKIGWGTRGDFTRAKKLIGAKIAANSPEDMKYLNQIIAQWHHDALGYWPGDLDKPGNKTSAEAAAERAAKRAAASNEAIRTDEAGHGWEAVLVSSAGGGRVTPPASYFDFHPDTGATVIEEPDENGFRRTFGYAGEWGVCHIGKQGQCVEVPEDYKGFPEFHLGRTKTDKGYLNTGLITYKVDHRDSDTILSESAEQQHFDNIAHAWAAVRLGQDDRGIWFSGVVLPGISDDDCVLIEAAGQVSGEWLYGSLRALQAVNVPGFPVMRSSATYDDEGNVVALVASTFGRTTDGCEPTAFERMQALAMIDAEVRMDALRKQYVTEES
jgi:8-oxo-dGTP pyrophosphatase MutT (NUDIX family)